MNDTLPNQYRIVTLFGSKPSAYGPWLPAEWSHHPITGTPSLTIPRGTLQANRSYKIEMRTVSNESTHQED